MYYILPKIKIFFHINGLQMFYFKYIPLVLQVFGGSLSFSIDWSYKFNSQIHKFVNSKFIIQNSK